MQPNFPFSAIVGQDTLKRALLLAVIQPSLGGVLIRGTKGVAKSTAVRALASLLPAIEAVVGCPFQRRSGEDIPDWPLPADAAVAMRSLPINVVMKLGYLDPEEVVAFLKSKAPNLHVVLTGRVAPPEICELADTVSEIRAVKHHYKAGIKAQQGIEF